MFSIKELRKKAFVTFKRSYWGIVLTCLLVAIVMGSAQNPLDIVEDDILPYFNIEQKEVSGILADAARIRTRDASDVLNEFLGNAGVDNGQEKWTNGALAAVINATRGSGNLAIGVLNALNEFLFKGKIASGIILSVGAIILLLINVFGLSVLQVGLYRYMLEIRRYSKTQLSRILFPWTIRRGQRIAWVMFVKNIQLSLWSLTIVGGIIKHYSYKLVPMIIAENPDMSPRQAITLSRRMMDGNKFRAFLLDLSFIGWLILGMATLSVTDIFIRRPYMYLTEVELYMTLREKEKARSIAANEDLCDELLDAPLTESAYPTDQYMIETVPARTWIQPDYDRSYSVESLILIFFAFSIIGWLWEVLLFMFTEGQFINRGTSYGPWLPIYGTGGVMILIILKKLRDKPALLFLATMILCGAIEYFTSWFLETTRGMRWWDYSGYFLNLNGRICLEGLLVFAIAGSAATYIIAPALDDLLKKIPKKVKRLLCVMLIIAFAADEAFAFIHPNAGKGITEYE